ncbi:MAG: hypothetical protein DYH14_16630 [Betaproteobacteria bacterium PRO3]|nr:hypothetical protein [Betaproteobacteria bacterium PRO3]
MQDEFAQVRAMLDGAPSSAALATWLAERRLLFIAAKVDGALIGWLVLPASDVFEARELGEPLADRLADLYGPLREAREAMAAAIRRASH